MIKLAMIFKNSKVHPWHIFIQGPWFGNRDMIVTSDPANLCHLMSSKFSNYPKGPDTKLLFEPYRGMLFSVNLDEWRKHRKIVHEFFNDQQMHQLTPKVNLEILEKRLIPVVDHASEQGLVLDLQDLLKRFMLDATSMIATGYNQGSLCIGLPEYAVLKALHDINHGILMRHILPERFWKIQSWLRVGQEKRLHETWKTFDGIAANYLQRSKEDVCISKDANDDFHAINFFSPEMEAVDIPCHIMIDDFHAIKYFLDVDD